MPVGYVPRWDLVINEYIRCNDQSRAYRKYYPEISNKNSLYAASSRFFSKPYAKYRLKELRDRMTKKSDITMEKVLTDYQVALEKARDGIKEIVDGKEVWLVAPKTSDIISAATAQAKLVGLLIERKEVGNAGDFSQMDNVSDILQAVSDQAGPEVALALSTALGLVQVISANSSNELASAEALFNAPMPSGKAN